MNNSKLIRGIAIAILLALVVVLIMMMVKKDYEGTSETGSEQIENLLDFRDFAQHVNHGETYEGKMLTLTGDIDCGKNWTPISDFAGTLDGNGHTITYQIAEAVGDVDQYGLFGKLSGTVKNLRVAGTISLDDNAKSCGGIVGANEGTLLNCYSTVNVNGGKLQGGIAADNTGIIEYCSASGKINNSAQSGGIVGKNAGNLANCVFIGEMTGKTKTACGMVAGEKKGTFLKCYYLYRDDIEGVGFTNGEFDLADGIDVKFDEDLADVIRKELLESDVCANGIVEKLDFREIALVNVESGKSTDKLFLKEEALTSDMKLGDLNFAGMQQITITDQQGQPADLLTPLSDLGITENGGTLQYKPFSLAGMRIVVTDTYYDFYEPFTLADSSGHTVQFAGKDSYIIDRIFDGEKKEWLMTLLTMDQWNGLFTEKITEEDLQNQYLHFKGEEKNPPAGLHLVSGEGTTEQPYKTEVYYAKTVPVAVGATYYAGDNIDFGKASFFMDDEVTEPMKGSGVSPIGLIGFGGYSYEEDTYASFCQFEIGGDDGMFTYTIHLQDEGRVPAGIKVKAGDGSKKKPYRFAAVYK